VNDIIVEVEEGETAPGSNPNNVGSGFHILQNAGGLTHVMNDLNQWHNF
jgi:hypothetical protein